MPPILYLLDGHALAYRTYYALTRGTGSERWRTSKGEPTAGVYGFASVLLRILEQEHPDYLAVAFDTGKTFRDDIFPGYKATRAKMPEDLQPQIERIRQLVDAFNIPRLEVEGYEADDVLGSISKLVKERGLGVKIITGDRDLLQLVDERIIVSLPGQRLSDAVEYTPEVVREKLGIRPDQIVDFKALVGDSSDNIPGVRGVGPKTAEDLLGSYGTLDNIYAHLDEHSPKLQEMLVAGREQAFLSRKLAKIVLDLDIPLDLEQARSELFDPDKVQDLFRELEFRSLFGRLQKLVGQYHKGETGYEQQLELFGEVRVTTPASQALGYEIVDTHEALEQLVRRLEGAEVIAIDTETTSTDQIQADLVGISLAIEPDRGYYIPLGHRPGLGFQLPLPSVLEALRHPLTSPKIQKIGHNLKYDYVVLARNGLRVTPLTFDSMIAEWLRDPNSRNLALKNLAWVSLHLQMTDIESLIGKGKSQRSMAEVPIERAAAYAAADAAVVLRLREKLQADLESRQAMKLFNDIEMPLVPILAQMEMNGISLDVKFLAEMSEDLSARMGGLENLIYKVVGITFNINSPQQLSEALFDRLRLQPPDRTRKTASGYYSTAAGVLEGLRELHPVVDRILEHRELSKLKSTYTDALSAQVNPQTGRVHTSYNQTGTVTGRIASSNPNLQNIPIRTEMGREVRKAFVAAPGRVLLSVDYSQVELRIVAHMANDEAMLNAFRKGQDIHATTAAAIFNVPLEKVTKAQRRHAKAINFGLIYGMSPFGLTQTTDLTLAEAENFVEAYFREFPGVKKYLDGMRRLAAKQGYVETLLGRKRYFPGLVKPSSTQARQREEREAINAPIQGTAADIIKLAMIRTPKVLEEKGLSAQMLLQVHDELVLECPRDELVATAKLVQQVMESAYSLRAPLKTDARFGLNWDDMSPVI
ncbi:MAG: DNA polymerase I [Chloroflexota bacterium]